MRSTSSALLVVDRIMCLMIPVKHQKYYSLIVMIKVLSCLVAGIVYIGGQIAVEWPVEAVTSEFLEFKD